MLEIINSAKEMYIRFNGTGDHLLLFWISLFFLLLWNKKNKKINGFLLIYSTIFIFIYICPVTAKIIMKYCIGEEVYWRMLWLLPYIAIIGYTATTIIFEMSSKKKRIVAFLGIIILIISTGTNIYSLVKIDASTGAAKIPSYVEAICEEILHSAQNQNIEIRAVMPDEITPYVRQYDASIKMPYGRNVPKDESHIIHDVLYAPELDYETLEQLFIEYECNYLVLASDEIKTPNLNNVNFELISQISGYDIYEYTS